MIRTGQNLSDQAMTGNIGHEILGWVRLCQEGNRAGQGESGPGNSDRCLGLPCEHITFFPTQFWVTIAMQWHREFLAEFALVNTSHFPPNQVWVTIVMAL